MRMASWEGPLPPPQALQAFEEAHPGSAAIIVAEFQAETAHRRRQEQQQADLIVRETHVGQALAFLFSAGCLGVAGYAIHEHQAIVGGFLGTTGIVAGILAFIRGRSSTPSPDTTDTKPKGQGQDRGRSKS